MNRVFVIGFILLNKKIDRNNILFVNIKLKKELGEDRKKRGGISKKFFFFDKKLSLKIFFVFEGIKGLIF